MAKEQNGCVKPARGPILPAERTGRQGETSREEAVVVGARVGREAVDFEAHAYIRGEGFKTIKLSDYRGKWIVLCFYPGDFTFV